MLVNTHLGSSSTSEAMWGLERSGLLHAERGRELLMRLRDGLIIEGAAFFDSAHNQRVTDHVAVWLWLGCGREWVVRLRVANYPDQWPSVVTVHSRGRCESSS
ncbi:hypothetical protein [Prescottella soli]|uniref:DUF4258 domain-containing protein n=2 Tax=Prescottella soli TaxID=1543852 RepID=A0ABW9FPR9_9NOCA